MDRFDALQAFARVVETGSFTRAAQSLHLGRASVSQLVQQLEARLRVRLLHRTTRRVQITPEGAEYYERVVRLLADLHEADAAVSGAAAQPAGRLRVDVPGPLARRVLVPALPELLAACPGLQVEMGVSDRTVDLLGAGVECVVRGGAIANPALVARRVGELPLGVFAAPGYLARTGVPEHPAALAGGGHHAVALTWGPGGAARVPVMQREGERIEVRLPHRLALDDACACLEAGVAGLGLVWLPHYLAGGAVAQGALVPVLAGWRQDALPLYAAYPANRHPSARVRAFIDWVARVLAREALGTPSLMLSKK